MTSPGLALEAEKVIRNISASYQRIAEGRGHAFIDVEEQLGMGTASGVPQDVWHDVAHLKKAHLATVWKTILSIMWAPVTSAI